MVRFVLQGDSDGSRTDLVLGNLEIGTGRHCQKLAVFFVLPDECFRLSKPQTFKHIRLYEYSRLKVFLGVLISTL